MQSAPPNIPSSIHAKGGILITAVGPLGVRTYMDQTPLEFQELTG